MVSLTLRDLFPSQMKALKNTLSPPKMIQNFQEKVTISRKNEHAFLISMATSAQPLYFYYEFYKGDRDTQFLVIHPDELTAYFVGKTYIQLHGGSMLSFLGHTLMPYRRIRHARFTVQHRHYYADPNRVFNPLLLQEAFFNIPLKYQYVQQGNVQHWLDAESHIKLFSSLITFLIDLYFINKGDHNSPIIVLHDNPKDMEWSKTLLESTLTKHYNPKNSPITLGHYGDVDSPYQFLLFTDRSYYNEVLGRTKAGHIPINLLLQDNHSSGDGSASYYFSFKNYVCIELEAIPPIAKYPKAVLPSLGQSKQYKLCEWLLSTV